MLQGYLERFISICFYRVLKFFSHGVIQDLEKPKRFALNTDILKISGF